MTLHNTDGNREFVGGDHQLPKRVALTTGEFATTDGKQLRRQPWALATGTFALGACKPQLRKSAP